MSRITLAQAAQWCGGTVDPKYAQISFLGASNDSRSVKPGQLFVALEGVILSPLPWPPVRLPSCAATAGGIFRPLW